MPAKAERTPEHAAPLECRLQVRTDRATLERIDRIRGRRPELRSVSAVVRYMARMIDEQDRREER
jgi:hypothetical protein